MITQARVIGYMPYKRIWYQMCVSFDSDLWDREFKKYGAMTTLAKKICEIIGKRRGTPDSTCSYQHR